MYTHKKALQILPWFLVGIYSKVTKIFPFVRSQHQFYGGHIECNIKNSVERTMTHV